MLIHDAPQEAVLWHSDEDAAAWPGGAIHLRQHQLVVLYVLENVECADDVELHVVGDASCVHLEQGHAGESPVGKGETLREQFAAVKLQLGEGLPKTGQHESRSAADLEQAAGVR